MITDLRLVMDLFKICAFYYESRNDAFYFFLTVSVVAAGEGMVLLNKFFQFCDKTGLGYIFNTIRAFFFFVDQKQTKDV